MKAMRQMATIFFAVLTLVSLASAARTSCHSSINITTAVNDYDSTGAQLLLRSDDYNGVGLATYSAAVNANIVSDIYGCNGEWFFELFRQSVGLRTIFIAPNDAVNSLQPPGPPAGYYWQDVELASACYDPNGNAVYLWAITTSSGSCDLKIDFYSPTGPAGAAKYKLTMGSKWSLPGAATGLVTVTCNAVNSGNGECVSWTITPNMTVSSANNPTVANLYYYARGGKLTFIGQYYNTFHFDLSSY